MTVTSHVILAIHNTSKLVASGTCESNGSLSKGLHTILDVYHLIVSKGLECYHMAL